MRDGDCDACGEHHGNRVDGGLGRRDFMRGAMMLGVGVTAAGAALLRPEVVSAAVPSPRIYSCSEWNARAARGAVQINNYRPSKIVIHHTATSNGTATTQAAAFSLARGIQNYHMDSNGWMDTGQNFTVSRGGYVMEGRHRSLETLRGGSSFVHGAHAGNENGRSIGIENEGTFTSVTPPAALYSARRLVRLHLSAVPNPGDGDLRAP